MPTLITKRGKKYWRAQVMKHGRTRSKLFPQGDKNGALAWETSQRAADWTTGTGLLTVHEWSNQYLDFCLVKFVKKTYLEKRDAFRRLFLVLPPETLIKDLTPGRALAHLQEQAKARSGNAANNDRKNLSAAWNWGIKFIDDFPRTNPFARVDKFPSQKKPRYVPPEADFWKAYDLTAGQDRVMLSVAVYAAARKGEIFRMKWRDVDFGQSRIRLWTRKRKDGSWEGEWLPMAGPLRDELRRWWADRTFKDSEYVFLVEDQHNLSSPHYGRPFTSRVHWMKKLCAKAEVKYFGWHGIRHLTASILYRAGVPMAQIQLILRHKSPTTTNRYLQSLGLEEARDAVEVITRPAKVLPFKADTKADTK